jgi:hypothetical protein
MRIIRGLQEPAAVQAVLAQQWRPNVALYQTCPGSTRALEIALVHGSAPPRYRAARVVLGTGEAFGPLESDDRVLSDLHGMTAAMWASSSPPPIMARPRVRELSL